MTHWTTHLRTGTLVLLALGAGAAIHKRLPDPNDIRQAPFTHVVSRHASVSLRTGSVNVLGLNASPEITNNRETARSQNGTFLVLDVEYTALKRPGAVAHLRVDSTDGRTFGGTPPLGRDFCGEGQPGIPLHCQVVFEMDKGALAGAKLRVPAEFRNSGNGDDVALIDLNIDAALAKDLAGRTTPLNLIPARVQER